MQPLQKGKAWSEWFHVEELGGQYATKVILVNVVELEVLVKQSKHEQNYQQLDNNPSYDNRRRKVKDGETIKKEETKVGETIKGFDIIKMDNPTKMGITKMVIIEMNGIGKVGIWSVFAIEKDIRGMIVIAEQYTHLENENKNSQLKIGVNVVIVEQYTPIIPTFVAIKN